MKKKNYRHPRYYTRIVNENNKFIELEYIDNAFLDNGERIKKNIKINKKDKILKILSLLNDLNKKEYNNLLRYIELQKKVLQYHKKNKQLDSVNIVKESILIMKDFKKYFIQR